MIRSMTAFARKTTDTEYGTISWEIRSLNHRYLEAHLRCPDEFKGMETILREAIGQTINRGKVESHLRVSTSASPNNNMQINQDALDTLIKACEQVDARLTERAVLNPLEILRWPGILTETPVDQSSLHQAILELYQQALQELLETRQCEGKKIFHLIKQRCEAMGPLVSQAKARLPEVQKKIRERLNKRLQEINIEIDQNRLEQELVFQAQKMDVAEELDRLVGHIQEVEDVLQRDEPVGRRLDFLMQELNREANTLGSKSIDAKTTNISVELKVLIEQMREQIQNVE